jgi:hypothetical protein
MNKRHKLISQLKQALYLLESPVVDGSIVFEVDDTEFEYTEDILNNEISKEANKCPVCGDSFDIVNSIANCENVCSKM